MSMILGQFVEAVLQSFQGQGRRDNTEWNEYNVIPHIYMARDNVLHMFLETGQVGRNYGSGTPGQMGVDGYVLKQATVSESGGVYSFPIPAEYADLKNGAGVCIVPLKGRTNPYRQIPYGFQWSGSNFMHMEGNIPWWVTPTRNVEFAANPNAAEVGLLMVESIPDPGEYDLDAELKFPAHLGPKIMEETLNLMGRRQVPDDSNNNRDQP